MINLNANLSSQVEAIETSYDLIQEHENNKAFSAFLNKMNIGKDKTRDLAVLNNIVRSNDLKFCHKYAIASFAIVLGLRQDVRA